MKTFKPLLYLAILSASFTLTSMKNEASASSISTEAELGDKLFSDGALSITGLNSCSTCHSLSPLSPSVPDSFSDFFNVLLPFTDTSLGATFQFGTRNTPTAGYTAFTPPFHVDYSGEYVGGQFIDGREDTLADQAESPVLNPIELAMPSEWAAVSKLKQNSQYVQAFKTLYNIDLNSIPSYINAPASANAPPSVRAAFRAMVVAIAEFEKSARFNKFTSKYDYYLAGQANLSYSEKKGLQLFKGKGNCSQCHSISMQKDTKGKDFPPLFSNYKYYNLGVPKNAVLGNNKKDQGLAENPTVISHGNKTKSAGKFRVPSLRNIDLTSPYFHNGVFDDLKQAVRFHNTRDKLPTYGDSNTWFIGEWWWPEAEVKANIETQYTGKIGLSNREEDYIVSFLKTLTDNYKGKSTSVWTDEGQRMIKALGN